MECIEKNVTVSKFIDDIVIYMVDGIAVLFAFCPINQLSEILFESSYKS